MFGVNKAGSVMGEATMVFLGVVFAILLFAIFVYPKLKRRWLEHLDDLHNQVRCGRRQLNVLFDDDY